MEHEGDRDMKETHFLALLRRSDMFANLFVEEMSETMSSYFIVIPKSFIQKV